MSSPESSADPVETYIARFPPRVRTVLRKIRRTVRRAVPAGDEIISYRMPALRLDGIVLYYAAFKSHIGVYPPVRGSASLERALSRYRGEKGNLKFPLDEPIPYGLIGRIAKERAKQNAEKRKARLEAARAE